MFGMPSLKLAHVMLHLFLLLIRIIIDLALVVSLEAIFQELV